MRIMASSSLNAIEKTGKAEMEMTGEKNANQMEIATTEQFGNLVASCYDTDPSDPSFPAKVELLAEIFVHLSEQITEELNRNSIMVANMSSKYKHDPELLRNISDWCETRKRLIKIADLSADEMDKNIQFVYKNNFFCLIVELLSSLNPNIYQELSSSIASCASSILPIFGLIMESLLPIVLPYLKYTGVLSCLNENLRTSKLIHHVLKAMREDKEKFEPLQKWFDETEEFEESVKQLFPYEIDRNIIESIENNMKDLGDERKIFVAAVLFMYKKTPSLCSNIKLLVKISLFCSSAAGKEWYKRILTADRPLNLETLRFCFSRKLQQLEEIDAEYQLVLEIGKSALPKASILPRLLLCGFIGTSVYFYYKKIKAGSKHKYSFGLRMLVKNSELFYNTMEKIRFRRLSATR